MFVECPVGFFSLCFRHKYMKLLTLIFFVSLLPTLSAAQQSLTEVYESRTFPCDTMSGTTQANICSGKRVAFADSLLNRLYKKIMKTLNSQVVQAKHQVQEVRAKGKNIDSIEWHYSMELLSYVLKLKTAIETSQSQWIKLKNANIAVIKINCEGGTSCVAITNDALIEEILNRIKKLESFGIID